MNHTAPAPQSPCIRNCCLDQNDTCVGCGRTLAEILQWREASAERQREILQLAHSRREQRDQQQLNELAL